MKKLLLIPLAATLFSCKSTYTSTLSTPMYAPAAEINPIRADVDVDMNKKISGSSQGTFFIKWQVSGDRKYAEGMNFSTSSSINDMHRKGNLYKLKASAAYKAVTDGKSDIIVHPNYVVETKNYLFFVLVKIKVFGYAGYFKKFYQEPYNGNESHHAIFPSDQGKQPIISNIISNMNKMLSY